MSESENTVPPLLRISDRITFLPVVHASGQFSIAVRRFFLNHRFDALAVPLPESFADEVERGILELPKPSIVVAHEGGNRFLPATTWSPDGNSNVDDLDDRDADVGDDSESGLAPASYVPIDPCQAVITAIRSAMGERLPRHYIDLEVHPFQPIARMMPDPYAVREVAPERFAAAVLPSIMPPRGRRNQDRMNYMAIRLMQLEQTHRRILMVDSVLHWPWIREAYNQLSGVEEACEVPGIASLASVPAPDPAPPVARYRVNEKTLGFMFGELPFITGLYERARRELEDDESLPIDGVKELLIAARQSYGKRHGTRGRKITPLLLSKCLQYIRNLSLLHCRLTPQTVTIATAAKQILGDAFAIEVIKQSSRYQDLLNDDSENADDRRDDSENADDRRDDSQPTDDDLVSMGIDQCRLPLGDIVAVVNRLAGPPMSWKSLKLRDLPDQQTQKNWAQRFGTYTNCSHVPEDVRIERFRGAVMDRARAIVGVDLAKTEKFTTSVKDGIDIRDTLRHWYEKQIYVKVIPPHRSPLDACVMLFDSPADPRTYRWRMTWHAEFDGESTLAFFGTDYKDEIVGPKIGLATYGGAMFLFPPKPIADIWADRRFDFVDTMEQRLIAAACHYSDSPQVALLTSAPPGRAFKRIAKHYRRQLVHVPLSGFSDEEIQQLRRVHVLGDKSVRSYAAEFIRRM